MKCDCGAEMRFKKGITKDGKRKGEPWAGNFCPACENVVWGNLRDKVATSTGMPKNLPTQPLPTNKLSPDEIALRLVEGLIKVKFYDFADRNETKEAIYNDFILFRNRL